MRRSIAILCFFLAVTGNTAVHGMDIAIVVNKDNPVDELSMREVEAIFELRQQFWRGGERVYVIIQQAHRAEKNVMLKKVYRQTDEGLNKYLLQRMFTGEISDFPQIESSNDKVKQEVRKRPNAIGFIDAKTADDSVKVLKIDRSLPGSENYRLKSGDPSS
jgi:ABC-type phosphate transport system substrate-binding protein